MYIVQYNIHQDLSTLLKKFCCRFEVSKSKLEKAIKKNTIVLMLIKYAFQTI